MSPKLATPVRDVGPAAAEFLQMLADPTRRQIFLLLMRGEVCNCELAAELDLAENLVSHHLRKLREAGLTEEHRDAHDARWIHYTVNIKALRTAWRALGASFDPSQLGSRLPGCCRST
jgi:ArsR family transcriptional regulator